MENETLEIIGFEDEAMSKLLGSLKRVETPGDFDFSVRARIAAARPSRSSGTWLPASIRLALPLGLMLLVGGYFALNSLYSPEDINLPAIADGQPAVAAPAVIPPQIESVPPAANEFIAYRGEIESATPAAKIGVNVSERRVPVRETNETPGGGSIDFSLGVPRQKIYPKGLDPNVRATSSSKNVEQNPPVSAKDILNSIGIDAAFNGSGWHVRSVSANNIAQRSGVKAGDLIEAMNDQTLDANTAFGGVFSGRSLRLRRDGASLTIVLKP